MTSFLRTWLATGTVAAQSTPPPSFDVSPPPPDTTIDVEEADDDSDAGTETDTPPAFPALSSAQRVKTETNISHPSNLGILNDSALMPPPPAPHLASRSPGTLLASGLSSSSLSPSLSTSSKSLLSVSTTTQIPTLPKKKRAKVALAPGHSPLDWANLKSSGADLRGVDTLMRIPLSVLKQHRTKEDAWSAFNGKVYNITSYLAFHPGGERELMRVAGRDGTELFMKTHAWVNVDFMLDSCLVGFLVSEPS